MTTSLQQSFSFELDHSKFPALLLLRNKENELMDEIDSIMQTLMSSRKFMSQMANIGGKSGPFDLNGRIVYAVRSKEIALKMGIFRGNSNQGFSAYVEPKEIIKLVDELVGIRGEITVVQNQISNHLSTVITQAARTINKGLDVVARMDVIFARAAFGAVLNGHVPHVGDDGGVIRVESFIHPVLAMNQKNTVPIDLLISNTSHQKSLIITGPNAGEKTI